MPSKNPLSAAVFLRVTGA